MKLIYNREIQNHKLKLTTSLQKIRSEDKQQYTQQQHRKLTTAQLLPNKKPRVISDASRGQVVPVQHVVAVKKVNYVKETKKKQQTPPLLHNYNLRFLHILSQYIFMYQFVILRRHITTMTK